MGGGNNSSSSSSRPLTAIERQSTFAGGLSALSDVAPIYGPNGMILNQQDVINGATNNLKSLGYDSPQYSGPGAAKQLAGGNYDNLQKNLVTSISAPLQAAKATDLSNVNDDMAKRGIWSSGLAIRGEDAVNKAYAPQFEKAGADAAAQRYALESGDNNNVNSFNLTGSAQKNSFDMENALRGYNSAWAPANFIQGAYNGTGGSISTGSGGGWNFSI